MFESLMSNMVQLQPQDPLQYIIDSVEFNADYAKQVSTCVPYICKNECIKYLRTQAALRANRPTRGITSGIHVFHVPLLTHTLVQTAGWSAMCLLSAGLCFHPRVHVHPKGGRHLWGLLYLLYLTAYSDVIKEGTRHISVS
jgi:hypothetical protein